MFTFNKTFQPFKYPFTGGSSYVAPYSIVSSTDPFNDGSLQHKFEMENADATVGVNATNEGASFSVGEFNQAVSFNGSSRFSVPSTTLTDNIFSYSVWINPTVSSAEAKYIVDFTTGRNILSAGSTMNENISAFNGTDWVNCGFAVPLNSWTHIVLTSNGSTFKIYKDKVLANTSTVAMASMGAGEWAIGSNRSSNVSNFSGKIDQLEIYNRVLVQSEIDKLFTQTSNGKVITVTTWVDENSLPWIDENNNEWSSI